MSAPHLLWATHEQLDGREIFQRTSHTLEQRDVPRTRSASLFSARELMKIGNHMSRPNHTFLHRNQQIAGLSRSAFVAFYKNTGALHGGGVHLTRMGLKGAHKIQVDAGLQKFAIEQRCLGRSAGAKYVGFSSAGSRVGSYDRQAGFRGHALREVPARLGIPSANQYLVKTTDALE